MAARVRLKHAMAAAALLSSAAHAGEPLRMIGSYTFPLDPALGGLSGIDYDPVVDEWVAISDDRSAHGPAHMLRLSVVFDAAGIKAAAPIRITHLRDESGETFPPPGRGREAVDPEAIRFRPGTDLLYWASEDDPADGFPPTIRVADLHGLPRGKLALPPSLTASRRNKAFEGLSFEPDGEFLWAALEAPLPGDGAPPDENNGALVRISRLKVTGELHGQYAYPVDAIPARFSGRRADNGVSEIMALDTDHMLVLERSGAERTDGQYDFDTQLYCADFSRASPIEDEAIPNRAQAMTKVLVATLPPEAGNLEGMALGPALPDGRQTIFFVSDNGFVPGKAARLVLYATAAPVSRQGLSSALCEPGHPPQ